MNNNKLTLVEFETAILEEQILFCKSVLVNPKNNS